MRGCAVNYSKGQMKIQQMAFMLVGLVIFFSMVALVYFGINLANLRTKAVELRDQEATETVRKISGMPEFTFTSASDCSSCIDLDRILFMKNKNYDMLWNFDYLMIERLDDSLPNVDCTVGNYPNCKKITIINRNREIATKTAFIALARWDPSIGWFRYEIGRIHASGKNLGGR